MKNVTIVTNVVGQQWYRTQVFWLKVRCLLGPSTPPHFLSCYTTSLTLTVALIRRYVQIAVSTGYMAYK